MNPIKFWVSEKLTKKVSREKISEFLSRYKTDSFDVLDLGSGGRPYGNFFPYAVGADIYPAPGVQVLTDAQKMPFKKESFSLIVTTEMLEHLPRPWDAVTEMYRVLKPGGRLILTTRFIFPIHDSPGDYFRYTKYGLRELFGDWQINKLEEETNALAAIGILFNRLGFQTVTKPKFLRFSFFLLAKFFTWLDFVVVGSYGEINRLNPDNSILCSGYYIECRKPN